MLTIKNMTYRVAGRTLFEGVNAVLSKGQHAGLVGRNGAGKSTLFKLILGETHSDQGEAPATKWYRSRGANHIASKVSGIVYL